MFNCVNHLNNEVFQNRSKDKILLRHRDHTVSEVYHKVHMRRVLHTARISNVNSTMFVRGIRGMVSFEMFFVLLQNLYLYNSKQIIEEKKKCFISVIFSII